MYYSNIMVIPLDKQNNSMFKVVFTAIIFLIAFLFIPSTGISKNESDYQREWCSKHNGKIEVVQPDRTRVDCIATIDGKTYAIEHDFANKFYQGIGQSLHYGLQTGHQPGIVLILKEQKEYRYWLKLNTIISHYKLPIRTWIIKDYVE